jgi:hypothetical protein
VVYVREGQDVQQWRVIAVGPRSLTIGTPERNVELAMFENTEQQPGAPAAEEDENLNLPTPPTGLPDPMPESAN